MIDEVYEKLSLTEQEKFSRIVNQLLSHTFLLVDLYDPVEQITRVNKDYVFIERNFDLFRDYFALAGFRLERDSNYGVMQLISSYEGNRKRFNKLTTLMVYVLRLIFEEEREKLNLSKEVIITTGELIQKMMTLGVVTKKPANVDIHASLRLLGGFHIVEKLDGRWEEPDARLLILPSILFIVTNEQISNMKKLVDAAEEEEEPEDGYEETE